MPWGNEALCLWIKQIPLTFPGGCLCCGASLLGRLLRLFFLPPNTTFTMRLQKEGCQQPCAGAAMGLHRAQALCSQGRAAGPFQRAAAAKGFFPRSVSICCFTVRILPFEMKSEIKVNSYGFTCCTRREVHRVWVESACTAIWRGPLKKKKKAIKKCKKKLSSCRHSLKQMHRKPWRRGKCLRSCVCSQSKTHAQGNMHRLKGDEPERWSQTRIKILREINSPISEHLGSTS